MKGEIDVALNRLHSLLAAIEELYDPDLWNTSRNALAIIYVLLKIKQLQEQEENRHLHVVGKEG